MKKYHIISYLFGVFVALFFCVGSVQADERVLCTSSKRTADQGIHVFHWSLSDNDKVLRTSFGRVEPENFIVDGGSLVYATGYYLDNGKHKRWRFFKNSYRLDPKYDPQLAIKRLTSEKEIFHGPLDKWTLIGNVLSDNNLTCSDHTSSMED